MLGRPAYRLLGGLLQRAFRRVSYRAAKEIVAELGGHGASKRDRLVTANRQSLGAQLVWNTLEVVGVDKGHLARGGVVVVRKTPGGGRTV
jgi:hypothetical protein